MAWCTLLDFAHIQALTLPQESTFYKLLFKFNHVLVLSLNDNPDHSAAFIPVSVVHKPSSTK
jgi:hypothetical protein